jgi:ATP-dependent DNA ligase
VRLSEHIEGDGPIIFEYACKMGLEGIVSKRRVLPYRSGHVRVGIKVKNPASPAMLRIVDEGAWQPRRTLRDYSSAVYTVELSSNLGDGRGQAAAV